MIVAITTLAGTKAYINLGLDEGRELFEVLQAFEKLVVKGEKHQVWGDLKINDLLLKLIDKPDANYGYILAWEKIAEKRMWLLKFNRLYIAL